MPAKVETLIKANGRLPIRNNAQEISIENEIFERNNIKRLQDVNQTIKECKKEGNENLVEIDGIWYWRDQERTVVMMPHTLVQDFLKLIHENPMVGGHLGREKTMAKAKENAWWPTLRTDVINFVKSCEVCIRHKAPTHKYVELKSIKVSEPCGVWAADVAFLPESTRGNRYLLVFMDYLTKWVVAAAIPTYDTNTVANVLLYSIVLVYGTPRKWITDNGKNFISEAMKTVCSRLGIKKVETSVEHPQSDGLVERMNRTVKTALATYVETMPDQWDNYLPFVTFAINTSKQASTGVSPFEAMFGRKAKLPTINDMTIPTIQSHNTKTWITYLNHYLPLLQNKIKQNLQESQERQQKYFNKNRKMKKKIDINDEVYKIKMKAEWKFPNAKFTGP
ncbi:hypothetical protein G6F18_011447 [Rhizopus arrhizus]|nr:hypothetical protein G6F24_011421 [Rhizopus arrhizus]KAG0782246.1 hypothetical protein G6F21_011217 [Rhizopus arrhizus]KAG0822135.1 hypothetical protein G6F19_011549 [Rhizopus arrhizus]KAG0823140.1 hypothetical protein G6F18_011447 [Rhizopus arrhizus]KAG0870625.1 hypothetical protein G6F15_011604 [Rhizopus arrhizus]